MKKRFFLNVMLVLVGIFSLTSITFAREEGNLTYANGAIREMADYKYWVNKLYGDKDRLLLDYKDISKINKEIIEEKGTNVVDLTKFVGTYEQDDMKKILQNAVQEYFSSNKNLYADGQLVDKSLYCNEIKSAILNTGFKNDHEKVNIYTVAVKRTGMKIFPTDKTWGFDDPNDPDDESLNSVLEVNEPFIVMAKCVLNGKLYYHGLSNNCYGWVKASDLAVFDTKQEWIDAWKVNTDEKDFLVVVQDKIILEESILSPKTSGVVLHQGTVLKLVPYDEMPDSIAERGTWYNYVVYLPTRDENGKYVREYALIPQHLDVSVGYLPLTRENILRVAFNCLGNRYSWGGMLGSTDCSLYCRAVYKCFGLDLPRNTSWQTKVPNRTIDLSDMTDEEKNDFISKLSVGTLLYLEGHVVMFIGNHEGTNFVINNIGNIASEDGQGKIKSVYGVAVIPLSVTRKNGNTFLHEIKHAVIYEKEYSFVG